MKTKKLTAMAMLCAVSYLVMFFIRIPVVLFLKYEAKDVFVTIGGFILGPLASVTISAVVSLLEMITVSDTGIIGLIMNILSTCSFAFTASLIYKKLHTQKGAAIGLASGLIVMTAVMLLWNYLITPLYMNIPRSQVLPLLTAAFLPFNLIKGVLNSAITLIIYKPTVTALRRTSLIEKPSSSHDNPTLIITITAFILLFFCVLAVLALNHLL